MAYQVQLDVNVIQELASNPASNHGLMLRFAEDGTNDDVCFGSSEGNLDPRPRLELAYAP